MLLILTLLAGAPPANLDFGSGKLTHWDNDGFRLVKRQITSSDRDGKGRTASLKRLVRVPAGARQLRCAAALYRPSNLKPGGTLDVVVETEDGTPLPRQVYDGARWKRAAALLPPDEGALREYAWDVSGQADKRVRIRVTDADARPRCHVVSTGFEFLSADDVNARAFATVVRRLERARKLPKMLRYDSEHFMALSNAGAAQTEYRLYNCETLYAAFVKHFKGKGFALGDSGEQLMVAMFSSQDGFESYLGQSLSSAVTGIYDRNTNRLAVYDFGTNRAFVESIKKMEEQAARGSSDLERQQRIVAFGKWVKDRRDDVNLSTIMHEAAHQASFNLGLLSRDGDVPLWLAEGLATYCEPVAKGQWLGIGAVNAERIKALRPAARGERDFLALKDLVRSDDWLRKATRTEQVLLGYGQSWALFRMLMEKRPKAMKKYLALIRERRTGEHRLADFGSCFGANLTVLEAEHRDYVRKLAE
jgi:hypothetical protein